MRVLDTEGVEGVDRGGPTTGVAPATGSGPSGQIQQRRCGHRFLTAVLGMAVVLGVLTGCKPVLSLAVDTAADGVDQSPGDGMCATAAGTCSLRAAISEANATAGFDRITILPGIDPVLTIGGSNEDANDTGDLDITSEIDVRGQGATIDGAGLDRVFHVVSGSLSIHDLTVTGGSVATSEGGGGLRSDGVLELYRTTVTGNTGGAVVSNGTSLAVNASTISGNGPADLGGAVTVTAGTADIVSSLIDDSRSGVLNAGTDRVLIIDSTVVSDLNAVVIRSDDYSTDTDGAIVRSTIQTRASDSSGHAIYGLPGGRYEPSVQVAGSVLDAPWGAGTNRVCGFRIGSFGYNVTSDNSCDLQGQGDTVATALLGPLADNGGPTLTMLPYVGSPAIDHIPTGSGFCTQLPFDQRGHARPSGSACDAGAVEGVGSPVASLSLIVDTAADGIDAIPGDGACATPGGACSLRAAVMETNATNPHVPDVVTIAPGINPVLTIAGSGEDAAETGDVDITGDLVIHGNGSTIDGSELDRVLDHSSASLALHDLTITGGSAPSDVGGHPSTGNGGGVRSRRGEVVATDVTLTGNHAVGSGGGLSSSSSPLDPASVAGSGLVVTDNSAAIDGGGIHALLIDLSDSTVAGNVAVGSGGGVGYIDATIRRSLFHDNTAGQGGGLARVSGSSVNLGVLYIDNSTISGNHANQWSAVSAFALFNPGLVMTASTISGNTGDEAVSGVRYECGVFGCGTSPTSTISGSILVGAPGFAACDSGLAAGSASNLAPDGSCGTTLPGSGALGPLADNGGPTLTHLPAAGSGAVDAVAPGTAGLCDGALPFDQRGVARPAGPGCDLGAVEQ